MAPNRSGSAPPTVEGSIAALRTFIDQKNPHLKNSRSEFSDYDSEEQLRSDPAYIAYYYANVNLNPRLPPPLISHENPHLVMSLRSVGVRKISVAEGLLATHREEPEEDMTSQQTLNGNKQSSMSVMDVASTSGHDRSALDLVKRDFPEASLHASTKSVEGENHHVIQSLSTTDHTPNRLDQSSGSVNVHGHVHNVTGFTTTYPPCPRNADSKDDGSTQSNIGSNISAIESKMSILDIPAGLMTNENQRRLENLHLHDQNTRFQATGSQTHVILQGMYPLNYGIQKFAAIHPKLPTIEPFVHNPGLIPPQFATKATYMNNSANYVHPGFPQLGFPTQSSPGGYIQNNAYPLQMSFSKAPMGTQTGEVDPYRSLMVYPTKPYVQNAFVLRPFTGPFQGRYFQPTIQEAQRVPKFHPHFPAVHGSSIPVINPPGIGNELTVLHHSSENPAVLSDGKTQRGSDYSTDSKKNSFLEFLKSSSSKKLELSDISRQVVEFSTDQHGSRFIQQKLEHCNNDEKDSVFEEVIPHALKLMTDIFGNYVIQKFFEHGTFEHRRRLSEQLTGQVLSSSLQMYGCRVIQKALEVIDLDQKVKLVKELDGHVMRCVDDQNGNHVIQKCIESVPAEKIGFIVSSFHDKVAELSSHPYGCRVIQRVLEHCSDEQISRCIINEILDSACSLAQDPYGNYVTQHILEMGKPLERTQIILKLTGKFKQMSQLKYASNVVEKCLKHGDAAERDLIIEEFIAESDNNDDLLVLMKDQFANYVVQKIFDLGTEKQKEAFLNCIKSNLTVLKRFTYAKQIVARYEQLTDAEGSVQDQT